MALSTCYTTSIVSTHVVEKVDKFIVGFVYLLVGPTDGIPNGLIGYATDKPYFVFPADVHLKLRYLFHIFNVEDYHGFLIGRVVTICNGSSTYNVLGRLGPINS